MSNVSDTRATGLLEDLELYTRIYRQMLLIRGFEDLVQSLFLAGEVYGTTHLYSGQEAIATGVASLLEDRDRVAATYRGHGHALALGVDDGSMVKVTGAAGTATLPVVVSAGVPRGGAWIEAAYVETAALPAYGAELSISKA